VRKTNWSIGAVAALAAAFALAGCAEQGDVQQLNQNEFTLRGMIASDRQQINSLKQQIQRQNDQIEEFKHGAAGAGGVASSMNDRVASLEAEVKALQAGMAATPGAAPPPAGPADSVGAAPAPEWRRQRRRRGDRLRPPRPPRSLQPGRANSIRKLQTPRPRTSRA